MDDIFKELKAQLLEVWGKSAWGGREVEKEDARAGGKAKEGVLVGVRGG